VLKRFSVLAGILYRPDPKLVTERGRWKLDRFLTGELPYRERGPRLALPLSLLTSGVYVRRAK
jgi:hypothetical protein